MARAVCDLNATSRWAVTGTPIQNRLTDLSSLLKFIRAYPYTNPRRFETDISLPWKSGQDEEAVKRLKKLSACLLLRRAKSTINLPPRRDVACTVLFTQEERAAYDRIRQQAIARIDEALGNESSSASSSVYVNVLQRIESLRHFCNLGLLYDLRHKKQLYHPNEDDWSNIAQRTLNFQREMALITCFQCTSALGLRETLLEDTTTSTGTALYTSCLRFLCPDCVDKLHQTGQAIDCGHSPPCQSAPISTNSAVIEDVDNVATDELQNAPAILPSKIKTLIEDIKDTPADTKWQVMIGYLRLKCEG